MTADDSAAATAPNEGCSKFARALDATAEAVNACAGDFMRETARRYAKAPIGFQDQIRKIEETGDHARDIMALMRDIALGFIMEPQGAYRAKRAQCSRLWEDLSKDMEEFADSAARTGDIDGADLAPLADSLAGAWREMAELQAAEAKVLRSVTVAWALVSDTLCDRGFADEDVVRKMKKVEESFRDQLGENDLEASRPRHAGGRRFVKTVNDGWSARGADHPTRAGILKWPQLVAPKAADTREKATLAPFRVALFYEGRTRRKMSKFSLSLRGSHSSF